MPDSVLWWKNSNFLYGASLHIVSSTETKKDLVQTASLIQFEPSWSNLSQLYTYILIQFDQVSSNLNFEPT